MKKTVCGRFGAVLGLTLLMGASAHAAIPTPRVKPPNPIATSRVLQGADYAAFKTGIDAGQAGRWSQHARQMNRLRDPLAKNVLAWQRAARDPNVPFDQLTHVTQNLSDWPRMTGIRAKAERKLVDTNMGARQVIAWFAGAEPVSGEGRAALARAHFALGNRDKGQRWLELAWRESKLTRDLQRRLFSEFGDKLTKDDHAARVDHLIWQGSSHLGKARALLPYVTPDQRALLDARITLRARGKGVNGKIAKVPDDLKADSGLLFERAYWRRKKIRDKDQALEPLIAVRAPVRSESGQTQMWREKRIQIYRLIGEDRFREAAELTDDHGMTQGLGFQQVEFLAGWLKLRKLGLAKEAETHFRTLRNGVSRPISRARASYWLARSLQAQGKSEDARIYFEEAAGFPNTYYGQLAALRTGDRSLTLPPQPSAPPASDIRLQVMRMLGEAGETSLLETFSFDLDDDVQSLAELARVSLVADEFDATRASVRASKQAGRLGSMLTETGYPMPVSITSLGPKFDIPFTLAIARQESEFAPSATSSAKAYGMMQMIDATAKATARKHGLQYSRSRMLGDSFYAAQMGSHHLNDLLARYDGSYILAAVAYNAGPGRARQWIRLNGDPRDPSVDAIDWVESIPFSETRNYVQRVLENMQVYKARLKGGEAVNEQARVVGAI